MKNETFALIWALGWLVTSLISTFRAVRGKQADPNPYGDVLAYAFAWPIYLVIFIVRWTKYKIRGQNI